MEDKVYVAWQDEVSRRWETIACLTKRGDEYELIFTKGAEKLDNISKKLFRLEPGNRYVFSDLIAIFKNKIPSKSRPDFHKMARWLGADPDAGEFGLLKAFGLIPSSIPRLPTPDQQLSMDNIDCSFLSMVFGTCIPMRSSSRKG